MKQEIIKALEILGFKQKGSRGYYEKDNLSIKVSDDPSLAYILEQMINYGATQKIWEFKRCMQITDSY